jgi:hypothetical protein
MKANIITGVVTMAFAATLAVGQTRYGNKNDTAVGQNATAQGTQAVQQGNQTVTELPPPNAPTYNPGFADEVPNKELSGNTPRTNSTLQEDGDGNMGADYFGWLGLIGLAGLFGLSRGTNPSPRPDIKDEKTLKHAG